MTDQPIPGKDEPSIPGQDDQPIPGQDDQPIPSTAEPPVRDPAEPPILEGAEPYSAQGDHRGALVLHGFTGCPQSMRPLAEVFAAAGYTVELPRLPGHGTTVGDMARYGWPDWAAAAEAAYADLAERTDSVVVAGLSMGGTLTLHLAEQHPGIAAIVLVNPVVEPDDFAPLVDIAKAQLAAGEPFIQGVGNDVADPDVTELAYTSMPNAAVLSLVDGLTAVKAYLASIRPPALILHSTQDHIVPPSSVKLLAASLTSPFEVVELDRSFHVATIDYDQDVISERAVAFAREHAS
jgi:carboxylesterase